MKIKHKLDREFEDKDMQYQMKGRKKYMKLVVFYFYIIQLLFGSRKAAYARAEYYHKHNIFGGFGGGGYWHPRNLPSFPKLIKIGNNVTVCADVKFFEHDIVHRMWNGDQKYDGSQILQYEGKIEIDDNVVIGGNSIILYNVHIGQNVLVAAGSVVTKDVEPYSIVAGNPARKIGDTRELYFRRLNLAQKTKE